jgi:tetratricopeptide (TPR) repeat protein
VRELLAPRHYRARARVDLERAELISMRGGKEDIEQAIALCDDALACVEQLDDGIELGNAHFSRACVLARRDREKEAIAAAGEARALYERHGTAHAIGNVNLFLAEVHVNRGRVPEASVLSAEAIEVYRQTRDSVGEANALMVRAFTWRARGKLPKALDDCERAVVLYELARLRTLQGRAMLRCADLRTSASRFTEAAADLEAAVRYLRESPETYELAAALLKLADTRRLRGDLGATGALLDEAEAALAQIRRPAHRPWALIEVCRLGKELTIPDKPRIRRCAAAAVTLARALGDAASEAAALAHASFAG